MKGENDLTVARDWLTLLMSKALFNPKVPRRGLPSESFSTEIVIDKFDIAAHLNHPLTKSIILFLKSRIASKQEYDMIKQLIQISKSEAYATYLEGKAKAERLRDLTEKNQKLRQEIEEQRKKVKEAQLSYLSIKDKTQKISRAINAEMKNAALVKVASFKIREYVNALYDDSTTETVLKLLSLSGPSSVPGSSPTSFGININDLVDAGNELKIQCVTKNGAAEIIFDETLMKETYAKYKLSTIGIQNVCKKVIKEILDDSEFDKSPIGKAEISPPVDCLQTKSVVEEFKKEIREQQKKLIDSMTEIQEKRKVSEEKETALKTIIKEKLSKIISIKGIDHVKELIQHAQNIEVIKYLREYNLTLDKKPEIKAISILAPQPNANLLVMLKKLTGIISTLEIFMKFIDGNKQRTDNFLNLHVSPLKASISGNCTTIISKVKELNNHIQLQKSMEYLQRKLYIMGNPSFFPIDVDKESFLNTAFFNVRMKGLHIQKLLLEGNMLFDSRKSYLADLGEHCKSIYRSRLLKEISKTYSESAKKKESSEKAPKQDIIALSQACLRDLITFRGKCSTEIVATICSRIYKSERELRKQGKLDKLIQLFIDQPAQKLIEFRKNEKTGKTIKEYCDEWKTLIGKST